MKAHIVNTTETVLRCAADIDQAAPRATTFIKRDENPRKSRTRGQAWPTLVTLFSKWEDSPDQRPTGHPPAQCAQCTGQGRFNLTGFFLERREGGCNWVYTSHVPVILQPNISRWGVGTYGEQVYVQIGVNGCYFGMKDIPDEEGVVLCHLLANLCTFGMYIYRYSDGKGRRASQVDLS